MGWTYGQKNLHHHSLQLVYVTFALRRTKGSTYCWDLTRSPLGITKHKVLTLITDNGSTMTAAFKNNEHDEPSSSEEESQESDEDSESIYLSIHLSVLYTHCFPGTEDEGKHGTMLQPLLWSQFSLLTTAACILDPTASPEEFIENDEAQIQELLRKAEDYIAQMVSPVIQEEKAEENEGEERREAPETKRPRFIFGHLDLASQSPVSDRKCRNSKFLALQVTAVMVVEIG